MKKTKHSRMNFPNAGLISGLVMSLFLIVRAILLYWSIKSFRSPALSVLMVTDGVIEGVLLAGCAYLLFCLIGGGRHPAFLNRFIVRKKASTKDEILRSIFERLEIYFEKEKPFLDRNMTAAGLALLLYTNRTYLSRAVSKHYGGNFSKYANSWRVKYAIEQFMQNPELNVEELSSISGFSSPNRFAVAFQIEMGVTPREWTRRYREHV